MIPTWGPLSPRAASATPLAMSAIPLLGAYGREPQIVPSRPCSIFRILESPTQISPGPLPGSDNRGQSRAPGTYPEAYRMAEVWLPAAWGVVGAWGCVCMGGDEPSPLVWGGTAWKRRCWISLVCHLSTQTPRTLRILNSRLTFQGVLKPHLFRYKGRLSYLRAYQIDLQPVNFLPVGGGLHGNWDSC